MTLPTNRRLKISVLLADITDEMVDNYSENELDALVQKIMKAKGF